MTSLKQSLLMLLLALGLFGAACGSNDNKTTTMSPVDSSDAGGTTGGNEDGGATGATVCVGGYAGLTDQQITDNIKDPMGACANPVDIAGVCTKNPSGQARDVGVPCYFSFAGRSDLTPEQIATMTGDCALNGKGTAKGLKTLLTPMSGECISCYVGAVVCSAQNCPAECGSGTDQECADCRAKNNCTSDFFACSGLPSDAEIKAAQ